MIRSRCAAWPAASASSSPSRSCAGCPNALSAPTLISDSSTLPVGQPQVDARAEVGQRAELAALLARRDDRLDRALADVLDRQQAEADRVALDREVEAAERWTSGGRTSMPSRRHSAMAAATFSALSRNAVSTAVMYSTV